ncbi:unnamed protein product [Trichobilharzia regenti]|nr:unnamed protein product [Trichobilharzia regenti]
MKRVIFVHTFLLNHIKYLLILLLKLNIFKLIFFSVNIGLPLVTLQWFLTLFSSVCPTALTFRIWDLLFYDGSVVLFRISLALLAHKVCEFIKCDSFFGRILFTSLLQLSVNY